MKLNPESLAKASSHHPWGTVIVWVALVLFAAGLRGHALGPRTHDRLRLHELPRGQDRPTRTCRSDASRRTRSPRRSSSPVEPGAVENPTSSQGQHVPDRPERVGPRCLPRAPGSVPADRGAGRRSTGGGTGPDPVGGRPAVLFTGIYTGDLDDARPRTSRTSMRSVEQASEPPASTRPRCSAR